VDGVAWLKCHNCIAMIECHDFKLPRRVEVLRLDDRRLWESRGVVVVDHGMAVASRIPSDASPTQIRRESDSKSRPQEIQDRHKRFRAKQKKTGKPSPVGDDSALHEPGSWRASRQPRVTGSMITVLP